MTEDQGSITMKTHEKFWAFLALLGSIILVTLPSIIWQDLGPERLGLADKTIAGLIGILGVVAGSLFRHSSTEENLARAAAATAEKVPPVTGEAKDTIDEQRNDDQAANGSGPIVAQSSGEDQRTSGTGSNPDLDWQRT